MGNGLLGLRLVSCDRRATKIGDGGSELRLDGGRRFRRGESNLACFIGGRFVP
jgi:hypothetical protein